MQKIEVGANIGAGGKDKNGSDRHQKDNDYGDIIRNWISLGYRNHQSYATTGQNMNLSGYFLKAAYIFIRQSGFDYGKLFAGW